MYVVLHIYVMNAFLCSTKKKDYVHKQKPERSLNTIFSIDVTFKDLEEGSLT